MKKKSETIPGKLPPPMRSGAPEFPGGDWFSENVPNWRAWLGGWKKEGLRALEIGSYEGRSACWLIENVLWMNRGTLECVDVEIRPELYENVARLQETMRVGVWINEYTSAYFWRHLASHARYDLIYVDGAHDAASVFVDAAYAWQGLDVGGVLIFDDYRWTPKLGEDGDTPEAIAEHGAPGPVIDAFLYAHAGRFEVLEDAPDAPNPGWQKAIRRIK
jgi:hypothetical protein